MAERLTNEEVQAQLERFEKFMSTTDLVKHGEQIYSFEISGNSIMSLDYVDKTLREENVSSSYYHPQSIEKFDRWVFYGQIFKREAFFSYVEHKFQNSKIEKSC